MNTQQRALQMRLFRELQIAPLFANACGNTFFIFDCLDRKFTDQEWEEFRQRIWDSFNAEVDDILVLRKAGVHIKMHVLEPDGTEADFCGNGARAVGFYLRRRYGGQEFLLTSRSGLHAFLYEEELCFVEMGKPLAHGKWTLGSYTFQLVDCVEPHLVTADFFDGDLLTELGRRINREWREDFPQGINVNCFRYHEEQLEVLTFERGIYAITKACGTGSSACVFIAFDPPGEITIKVLGGFLRTRRIHDAIWLGGPVLLQSI